MIGLFEYFPCPSCKRRIFVDMCNYSFYPDKSATVVCTCGCQLDVSRRPEKHFLGLKWGGDLLIKDMSHGQ